MQTLEQLAAHGPLSLPDLQQIESFMLATEALTPEAVHHQIAWFVKDLAIDAYYFRTTPIAEIARHILALGVSELVSRHGGEGVTIQLVGEDTNRAIYIVEDRPAKTHEIEERIESRYPSFRLESYRTRELPGGGALRFYIATRPEYPVNSDETSAASVTAGASAAAATMPLAATPTAHRDFRTHATTAFLDRSETPTIERYAAVWEELQDRMAPVIRVSDKTDTGEQRVMIGMHGVARQPILTSFSRLFQTLEIDVRRRYIEPFRGGDYIITFYTDALTERMQHVVTRELNAVAMMRRGPVADLFRRGDLAARKTMYAIAAADFTHQFVTEFAEGYGILQSAVAALPEARGILETLRGNLTKNTFSTLRIARTVATHPEVISRLYEDFAAHNQDGSTRDPAETSRLVEESLTRDVSYHRDRAILTFFHQFNRLIDRTNFFRESTVALAFRMKHGFLDRTDFPDEPFGVFFVVGREFSGFHVRFRDIARGGIRIVRSRTADAWARNVDTIFQENYNLAATQQRKNKDIPEGGSKGIVLLNAEHSNDPESATSAFRSYVDALLDVLSGTDEVLFLGPDEGSAGLMDWAALHAQRRGYPFWKGFTTGKSLSLGGVPHDRYGMTTRSVHRYVTGTLTQLGLDEQAVTKIQTGGPDGDLGSNEILISKDITIGIVDGSGVLYDPDGLNRTELTRLATVREMVSSFDRALLGPRGFFVSVDDRDVRLPDGSVHANGEVFRNNFHVSPYMTCDLFVPCGGRPGAITVANWKALINEDGTPRVKIIVEGANLFITHEARLRLEEHGVILFKDASTNKGGVTSSSLEVFAGLAMSDEEFRTHMTVPAYNPDAEPPFRQRYVNETIARIEENAAAEFALMWQEREKQGRERQKRALTLISDEISNRINRITDSVASSPLADNPEIRRHVLSEYVPQSLQELVGIDTIIERVPAAYIRAIVASWIASRLVYRRGLDASEVDFALYMDELRAAD